MPPRRKAPTSTRKAAEAPITEYDKVRAQNMMRNNQVLARLGVNALASIVNSNNASARTKGDVLQGLLYDGQEKEGTTEDDITKAFAYRGSRTSKRVVAPQQQEEPTRMTRQKTAATKEASTLIPSVATQDDTAVSTDEGHDDEQNHITEVPPSTQEGQSGRSIGRELDKISRGLKSRIPIHVPDGKRRPEAPMQAAKFASEGGIILRQHIPILPHWKEYKKDEAEIKNYIGKVVGGQRQIRYRLKKKYFDGVPANQVRTTSPVKCMTDDQWRELVDMWSSPKHKEKCTKNQLNREKKQEKYKDKEPSAIDLFMDMHCSKNIVFSEPVKKAIADMQAIVAKPVDEGQQPKTCMEAVSQVLPPSSTFLHNVGLQTVSKKRSKVGVSSQVQELQAQLEAERQQAAGLRQEVEALKSHAQDSETAMSKQSEEIVSLKKSSLETNNLLRQLISFGHGQTCCWRFLVLTCDLLLG